MRQLKLYNERYAQAHLKSRQQILKDSWRPWKGERKHKKANMEQRKVAQLDGQGASEAYA